MTISGQPVIQEASATDIPESSTTNLVIGIGAFVLALGAVGYFILRSRRHTEVEEDIGEEEDLEEGESEEEERSEGSPRSLEALLDDIVALDDLYQAGDLPQEAYQQRRAALKVAIQRIKEKQA